MKFRISATSIWKDEDVKLIEEYPCLKEFGYTVEPKNKTHKTAILDENGNLIYQDTPYVDKTPYIHINNIEELMNLMRLTGHEIVVDNEYENSIEIYDGYRE